MPMLKNILNLNPSLVDIVIYGLATTKFMMIYRSFGIAEWSLLNIKKTDNDWLRIFLTKIGMFFDCPVCLSVLAGITVILVDSLNHTINVLFAISVIGLLIKKKFLL